MCTSAAFVQLWNIPFKLGYPACRAITCVQLDRTEGVSTLKGIAQIIEENELHPVTPDAVQPTRGPTLKEVIRNKLDEYFDTSNGEVQPELYTFVIKQVEKPLIEKVLEFTNGNQSAAAKLLGISRGTLRKKILELEITI